MRGVRFRLALALLAVFALAETAPAAAGEASIRFDLPVACELGKTCWAVQYPDVDPGPGVRDFACGERSYRGHEGTDFGVASLADMRAGVPVIAAADGVVSRVRDGIPDQYHGAVDGSNGGLDCGNGVVIKHGGDLRTVYCHLRQGSVRVEPGAWIRRGEPIGLIGMSGRAQFPHVEFAVFREGEMVDPFLGLEPNLDQCGISSSGTLWSEQALHAFQYRPSDLYAVGFSTSPLETRDVDAGRHVVDGTLDVNAPALLAWGIAWFVRAGDLLNIRIEDPDGETLLDHATGIDRSQARRLAYAGRRQPEGGWLSGTYRATVTLQDRDGVTQSLTTTIDVH